VLIAAGAYSIAKNAYHEKRYGKMLLCVLAGIIALLVVTVFKKEWQADVRRNVLEQARSNCVETKFNPLIDKSLKGEWQCL